MPTPLCVCPCWSSVSLLIPSSAHLDVPEFSFLHRNTPWVGIWNYRQLSHQTQRRTEDVYDVETIPIWIRFYLWSAPVEPSFMAQNLPILGFPFLPLIQVDFKALLSVDCCCKCNQSQRNLWFQSKSQTQNYATRLFLSIILTTKPSQTCK